MHGRFMGRVIKRDEWESGECTNEGRLDRKGGKRGTGEIKQGATRGREKEKENDRSVEGRVRGYRKGRGRGGGRKGAHGRSYRGKVADRV